MQRNYQSAANSFRDALRGDGDPKWTEVWSHIHLGYIFDVTGQRDRAVNEYRLAVQTNDNTQGAINEARARMQNPLQARTRRQLNDFTSHNSVSDSAILRQPRKRFCCSRFLSRDSGTLDRSAVCQIDSG